MQIVCTVHEDAVAIAESYRKDYINKVKEKGLEICVIKFSGGKSGFKIYDPKLDQ